MKFITRRALARSLMLALLQTAIASADPPSAPNLGCLGERIIVKIRKDFDATVPVTPAGGIVKGNFLRETHTHLQVTAIYVRALKNGQLQWVSRHIEWSGTHSSRMVECDYWLANAGGSLELGPYDGTRPDLDPRILEVDWNNKQFKLDPGGCFRETSAGPGEFPRPTIAVRNNDQLRNGCCYEAHIKDGDYDYSERVEQTGNEEVNIKAAQNPILPNADCVDTTCTSLKPDVATTELKIAVTCNGLPLKNRQIGLGIRVEPRSGGHMHLPSIQHPHPRGTLEYEGNEANCGTDIGDDGPPLSPAQSDLSCITVGTDANGEAKAKFKVPLTGLDRATYNSKPGYYKSGIAGDYTIFAKDARFPTARDHVTIHAGIIGGTLVNATFGTKTTLQPGRSPDVSHPAGYYGTTNTLKQFNALAVDFAAHQDAHNAQLATCNQLPWTTRNLQANDIALPTGGVFDLGFNWAPSHQTHNRGEGGDFNRLGAGASNKDLDFQDIGTECNGSKYIKQYWLMHLLLNRGNVYGRWDCTDLSGGAPSESPTGLPQKKEQVNAKLGPYSGSNCIQGTSDPSYFPPNLHLHVDDY
jgi:hypothetical protein